ncbi:MAG: VOC family protein [Alphaproteobacteria bacterium]|nr:VOC family protein [Alphaproteobacteria bacterium]
MAEAILKRTTFVVPDAERAAKFYMHVFGMTKWYENRVPVHPSFPPAAPPWAPCHLILLKAEDPMIGMLGLLQYLDQPFDTGTLQQRTRVRMGETLLVFETKDVDGVYRRPLEAGGATILAPPTDWDVPSHDAKSKILLRTMSMFDPNGIYMEVNQKR